MTDEAPTTRAWRWVELCAALNLPETAGPDVQRVVIDSRGVRAGDLFIALPGDPGPRFNPSHRSNVDGHDFVRHALDNGAAGALVHKTVDATCPLLVVEDTYDGLWQLARVARERLRGDVVAVTGSSGKTTFKNFLAAALHGYAPPGSYNNHIGVPLSLINAPPASGSWVFEVGTNHPGEIAPLRDLIDPNLAVVVNVHEAHIENFRDRADLVKEKLSLISKLKDKSKKVCEYSVADETGISALTFGRNPRADACAITLHGDRLEARVLGSTVSAKVPGGGWHRAETLVGVLLVTRLLGRDMAAACELTDTLVPQGRGDIEIIAGIEVVDDSYNANPASMRAAIEAFLDRDGVGRTIGVLGQMGELGPLSVRAHGEIAAQFPRFDEVFSVGQAFRGAQSAHWHESADEDLIAALKERLRPGDRVLIKGSNVIFWTQQFVARLKTALAAQASAG